MKPRNKYERELVSSITAIAKRARVQRTRNCHIKVTLSEGAPGTVFFSGSPSDHRSIKNGLSRLRQLAERRT